jgi:hypothetical protein
MIVGLSNQIPSRCLTLQEPAPKAGKGDKGGKGGKGGAPAQNPECKQQ